ncbi:ornithine cyclodeaminase family protein [Rhizobium sp. SSA_523]|uniref:ornithine cyclodeaminase family protein n=1 Tax=Rhizobium sp. SSA_523 TaxID=2952477 RepID=UPI0020916E28|nr:ornithine cyclodeaminase family protein [Rhizobium sp. SSA_523]MCO5734672.1 ornithine cyclodeaminase family protein [Rhizobium sp. SSA_523]WKC23440.1 ornithine cyclodeaminase family protein [Rhizobium sp. SSA_523]
MFQLNAHETQQALPMAALISAIESMFRAHCVMPLRHHHEIELADAADQTVLLMPAWVPGAYLGVKILNLVPDNHLRGLPTISGQYLLSNGRTGETLALVEGAELTARRTAATSALAARALAHPQASELLMVGTGRLSLNLIEAHACVRPLTKVAVWGRDRQKAEQVAQEARSMGFAATAVADLAAAAGTADIISCATLSSEPLIQGEWLKPGAHLDLVGAFKPSMRESDDAAIRRASIFVDTRAGATKEAGDIVQPLAAGLIGPEDIRADLYDLTAGRHAGRSSEQEITLFKSVGAALEDLAGAILAYETVRDRAEA